MESEGITVQLGAESYRIVPQRLGRIERKLRVVFEVFGSGDAEEAAGLDPAILHEGLQVFIPDLMPEWQMRGLPGEGQDYDEARDKSPTVPELIEAVEAVYKVNGGDRLVRFFGKFVDPKVIEKTISMILGDWAAGNPTVLSGPSPNSPPTNGGSDSTSSIHRAPISLDEMAGAGETPTS